MLFRWHQITAHLPSPPGCSADLSKLIPSLLSVLFQGFRSLLSRLTQQFLSPYFCFSHKYLSWLPSLVAPHPRADFKQPAASSSVRTSVCYCHLTKANAMLKCLVLVASNTKVMMMIKQVMRSTLPKTLLFTRIIFNLNFCTLHFCPRFSASQTASLEERQRSMG